MVHEDIKRLMESILDYTRWIRSIEDQRGSPSGLRYTDILTDFLFYVIHKGMVWKEMFTSQTLEAFQAIVVTREPTGPSGPYRIIFLPRAESTGLYISAETKIPYRRL